MELSALWSELSGAAARLGVELRVERLGPDVDGREPSRGGLCIVRGRRVILVDERAPLRDRIGTLAVALSRLDVESLRLSPFARETVEAGGRPPSRRLAGEARAAVPPPPGAAWVRVGVAPAANDAREA